MRPPYRWASCAVPLGPERTVGHLEGIQVGVSSPSRGFHLPQHAPEEGVRRYPANLTNRRRREGRL